MGDQSLMKKILYSLILVSPLAFADLSVQQIEQMVAKIHEKREGVKLETLQTTKEPFVRLQQDAETQVAKFVIPVKTEEAKVQLHAIVNGKAFINNDWYAKDENVMGYTVKSIDDNSVELANENNIKKLFLHEKKDNFIQIEERK